MLIIPVKTLDAEVEMDDDGRFELPNRPYTTAELNRIAREINRFLRTKIAEDDIGDISYEE